MLVFCGSGVFIALEYQQDIKFHEAMYFMFITITTIGYGDFAPLTPEGQIFVVFFMSLSLVSIYICLVSLLCFTYIYKTYFLNFFFELFFFLKHYLNICFFLLNFNDRL